jgi:tetratricopeptide (TPR) repeat protein
VVGAKTVERTKILSLVNIRIPCLVLLSWFCALPLRAQDAAGFQVETNAGTNVVEAGLTNPPASGTVETVEPEPAQVTEPVPPVQIQTPPVVVEAPPERYVPEPQVRSAAPVMLEPRGASRSDEPYIWFALTGVLLVSVISLMVTWQNSRRNPEAAPAAPRVETPATIVPTLLPVISQAIKEALVQELSAQRRELLTAQQEAATELSQLARRLEAVQTPLLERLVAPRPAALPPAKFSREIPVSIFCPCGQKFAFEVQPVEGRMPFSVACPACGQDGTNQANQVILRLLNGTNLAPSSAITPQLVDAVKQAVVKELAGNSAEAPRPAAVTVATEHKNGSTAAPGPGENPPENVLPGLLAKGQTLAEAGELDKAVKCLEAALALQPDRTETLLKLGGVLDRLDRADEALQQYDRALALDDSLTIAYLNKGGVFNRLARYDEALRCYEQALLKQKKVAA